MEHYQSSKDLTIEERRQHTRYTIPTAAICTFLKGTFPGKNCFQGFIHDISLGGASLEIKDESLLINDGYLQYTNVEISCRLHTAEGVHKITLPGIVRWYKKTTKKGKQFVLLGIQFLNVDQRTRETLGNYLAQGARDQTLMWNLWDTISHQP